MVGEVLKNYHPHGDSAVYDALVRMAQTWVMRYPLIDAQGNFGSVDGDPPAAYRYTECRLNAAGRASCWPTSTRTRSTSCPTSTESQTEPDGPAGALPNLLMNGSDGIAVGMATNIPPHNLGEIIDALAPSSKTPTSAWTKIRGIIPGPDFPTGGRHLGPRGHASAI